MTVQIWQGALAPCTYVLDVPDAAAPDVDLSKVTAAAFVVLDPHGNVHRWIAEHEYVDHKLIVRFEFGATESEIAAPPGKWPAFAELTLADDAGTVRTNTAVIEVLPKFGLLPN